MSQPKKPQIPFQRKQLSEEEQFEKELLEMAEKELQEEKISKDYTPNVVPADFVNQTKKSEPNLETIYGFERKRTLYIYPLENLYRDTKTNDKVSFSQNIIKIGFIDVDKVKESIAYETSDFNIQLTAEISSNPQDNSTEYSMVDTKTVIFQNQNFINEYGLKVVSINKPVTKDNLDQLYIMKNYNQPYMDANLTTTKQTTLQRLREFKTRDGNSIIPILQKTLESNIKITGLKIKAPRSTLFGNIKILGKLESMELFPKLFVQEEKVAFPNFTMTIETDPKVRVLQQWFSDQILPWRLAKQFLSKKSVLDLIKIGGGTETRKEIIKNARATNFWITYDGTSPPTPSWPLHSEAEIKDKEIFEIGSGILGKVWISSTDKFHDVEVEIKDAPAIDSLQKVLLNMLTYTYTYNRNFDGATLDPSNANELDKMRAKFEGQKPEDVITNLFNQWKLDYPDSVNLPQVKIFKQIVVMLSKYILSNLSINKGLNDDNKILLPYYFELKSNPIHSTPTSIWEFKDVEVILKSEYFNFSDINNIKIISNDISQNQLFKLDDNQFNWLPIVNELESNQIPSLIPADISLSNGEYGKYFTRVVINKTNIEKMLNLYGSNKSDLYSKFAWYKEIIAIDNDSSFETKLENPISNLNRIEMSAIFGAGNYELTLITDSKEEINLNNINLFSDINEKISYININL